MAKGKTEQWAKLPYAVHRKGLGPWARLVYAVLLDESRGTGEVGIGMRRLMGILETSRPTIAKAIRELESIGLLIVKSGANGVRNRYELPEAAPGTGKDTLPVARQKAAKKRCTRPVKIRCTTGKDTLPQPVKNRCAKIPEQTSSREDRPADKPRKRTPNDDMWDAVIKAFRLNPKSKRQKGMVGKAVKEFTAMEVTPAEVELRVARYRRRWPEVACTPNAVMRNWEEFENDSSSGKSRPGRVEPSGDDYPPAFQLSG